MTGAVGKGPDGNVQVNATSTLLACRGDFSANGEMVLALQDEVRQLAEISGIDTTDPSAFMGMGQRRYGPEACLLGWRRDGTRSSCGHELRQCWPGLNGRGCTTPVFGPDGKRYNDAQLQLAARAFRPPSSYELLCTIAMANGKRTS